MDETTQQFTEAEERFISLVTEGLGITQQIQALEEQLESVNAQTHEAQNELGLVGIGRSGLAHVAVLLHESARRAGVDESLVDESQELVTQIADLVETMNLETQFSGSPSV